MKVYLISSIEDFGKMISYCINNDLNVCRVYWCESEKNNRCIHLDFKHKRVLYGIKKFYALEGYEVVIPVFELDQYGEYQLLN